MSILALLTHNYIAKKTQHYSYYGNVDKCAIYYFDDIKPDRVRAFFSGNPGIEMLKLCSTPALVYYDDDKNYLDNNQGTSIVSFCEFQNGGIHECKNFVNTTIN